MVTLIPPAFITFPESFIEDWMDKKITTWTDEGPDHPIIYSQPVLLFNALGQIGQKATVGNKINPKNMEIIYGMKAKNYQHIN